MIGTTLWLENSANVGAAGIIPCIAQRLVRSIELGVWSKLVRTVRERVCRGNTVGVAISGDTEYNLVRWHFSVSPSFDGRYRRTLLVSCGSTCIIQRCVRPNERGPQAPNIIVHDRNVVEDISKARDIFGGIARGITERGNCSRCGECQIGPDGCTKFLEEGKEILRVIQIDCVASYALVVRIFPTARCALSGSSIAEIDFKTYSKLMPSTSYWSAKFTTLFTKAVRFSGVATLDEK